MVFLLANKCLQIRGSDAYFSYVSTNAQDLVVGDSVDYEVNTILENVSHLQGTAQTIIREYGIYDLFADIKIFCILAMTLLLK